jgi:hypothetical protein
MINMQMQAEAVLDLEAPLAGCGRGLVRVVSWVSCGRLQKNTETRLHPGIRPPHGSARSLLVSRCKRARPFPTFSKNSVVRTAAVFSKENFPEFVCASKRTPQGNSNEPVESNSLDLALENRLELET